MNEDLTRREFIGGTAAAALAGMLADPSDQPFNREAGAALPGECRLEVVPGATHLFEEPGALEEVARLARDWFLRWMAPQAA